MIFLYDIALVLVLILSMPKLCLDYFVRGKYRTNLRERLGMRGIPKRGSDEETIIWMHTISVGETKAALPLLKEIFASKKNVRIVVSSVTETGHAEAKRILKGATDFFYLPLDFSWIIRKSINSIKPDLTILVEGEFWYNWLYYLKRQKSKIVLVNGKISERSAKRFQLVSFFTKKIFSFVDLYCVQNEIYKSRFESLGVPTEKIQVTGNLKFDFVPKHLNTDEKQTLKDSLGIGPKDRVIVLGSTHDEEEELLLKILSDLSTTIPEIKTILVPRHPERFAAVLTFLKQNYSSSCALSENSKDVFQSRIVLVDKMGVLNDCYQLAQIAIVAGSFTGRVGGHNILEPLAFGVPVIFGPFMYAQEELKRSVLEFQAGIQANPTELKQALQQLLQDRESYEIVSKNGQKLLNTFIGTAKRTFENVGRFI